MGVVLPNAEKLRALPRPAVVAFAARCARRIEPLALNSQLPERIKKTVTKAILFVETFASGITSAAINVAQVTADVKAAASAASLASVKADDASIEIANRRAANAPNASAKVADAAASAVHAACNAAFAAKLAAFTGDSGIFVAAAHAAANAAEGAGAAAAKTIDADTVKTAIRHDFGMLLERAKAEKWTNDTPVPPSVFGEMWPEGAPDWAQIKATKGDSLDSTSGQNDLVIDLWIDPGNATVETLQKVLVALSELHIAAGGTGLEFKADSDFIYALELAPA
jgi:hypothetical protein